MKSFSTERKEGLALYKKLCLARLSEESIRKEYFKDQMKTPVHLGIGGEAIPVGVCHCLPKGSKTFGTYRNHSLFLSMTGGDTHRFFAELYGRETGSNKGKAGSMHLMSPQDGLIATSAVVGTTIPLAVGCAFAHTYQKSNEPVVSFFGDGAVEEGVFWESLNFAALHRLPILFVCEDNDLAIHTPKPHRRGFNSLITTVKTYNVEADEGDGSNVLEVISRTDSILKAMKKNHRPGFLRFTYYRFLEHVGPSDDFNAGYRQRPSSSDLENFDPVKQFEKKLIHEWNFPIEDLLEIRKGLEEQISRSILKAQSDSFPGTNELYTDVLV